MASITALFGMEKLAPAKGARLEHRVRRKHRADDGRQFPSAGVAGAHRALSSERRSTLVDHDGVYRAGDCACRRSSASSPIFTAAACCWRSALIAFGLFGAAMAFAPSFGWLLFFRTLQGVAFSRGDSADDRFDRRSVGRRQGNQRPGTQSLSRPHRLFRLSAARRTARDDRLVLALCFLSADHSGGFGALALDARDQRQE